MAEKLRVSPVWLVIGTVLAAFVPVCGYAYVNWDDSLHVYQNPYLNPITPGHLLHFWRLPYGGLYVPVSYMAFALLASMGRMAHAASTPSGGVSDLDPHVFHMANLLLHLANVALVYSILRVVVRRDWAAAVGALLFGLHPIQVEAVGWISELRGLLATFFGLVAVRSYLTYAVKPDGRDAHPTIGADGRDAHPTIGADGRDARPTMGADGRDAHPRIGADGQGRPSYDRTPILYAVVAVVAFAVALLAKPSVIPLPVIAGLLTWVAGVDVRRRAWPLAVWSMLIVPVVLVAHGAQPASGAYVVPVWQRPFVAGDALTFYLGKLLWPVSLGEDYGRTPNVVIAHGWAYLEWIIPVAVTIAVWRWSVAVSAGVGDIAKDPRNRVVSASWPIFVAALSPNLGFLPFIFQRYSTVADRYVYLAMLGPALLAAWVVDRCVGPETSPQPSPWKGEGARRTFALTSAVLVMFVMFVLTSTQVRTWRDSDAMLRHSIAVNPSSAVMHYNLGVVSAYEGRADEAVREYGLACRLNPNNAQAHCNLASLLASRGDAAEAMREYRQAIAVDPNLVPSHYGLAMLLSTEGRPADAALEWRATLRLWPSSADAHYNLGIALYQVGKLDEAARELRVAVDMDPGRVDAQRTLEFVLSKEAGRSRGNELQELACRYVRRR